MIDRPLLRLRLVADEKPPRAACREGCSHCCRGLGAHEPVVRRDELARLRRHPAWSGAVARAATAGDVCAFLVDDRCSVWAERPLVCRAFWSEDAKLCEQGGGAYQEIGATRGDLNLNHNELPLSLPAALRGDEVRCAARMDEPWLMLGNQSYPMGIWLLREWAGARRAGHDSRVERAVLKAFAARDLAGVMVHLRETPPGVPEDPGFRKLALDLCQPLVDWVAWDQDFRALLERVLASDVP